MFLFNTKACSNNFTDNDDYDDINIEIISFAG